MDTVGGHQAVMKGRPSGTTEFIYGSRLIACASSKMAASLGSTYRRIRERSATCLHYPDGGIREHPMVCLDNPRGAVGS